MLGSAGAASPQIPALRAKDTMHKHAPKAHTLQRWRDMNKEENQRQEMQKNTAAHSPTGTTGGGSKEETDLSHISYLDTRGVAADEPSFESGEESGEAEWGGECMAVTSNDAETAVAGNKNGVGSADENDCQETEEKEFGGGGSSGYASGADDDCPADGGESERAAANVLSHTQGARAERSEERFFTDFVLFLRWLHTPDTSRAVSTGPKIVLPTMPIHLPHTICFLEGVAVGWYFTSVVTGDVRRKKIANVKKSAFEDLLMSQPGWGAESDSIAGMFVSSTVHVHGHVSWRIEHLTRSQVVALPRPVECARLATRSYTHTYTHAHTHTHTHTHTHIHTQHTHQT